MKQSTSDLVLSWKQYVEADADTNRYDRSLPNAVALRRHDQSIIRAIELELQHRPVKERMEAGYPK